MRELAAATVAFLAMLCAPCAAAPSASFAELTYAAHDVPATPAGQLPQPDPAGLPARPLDRPRR